MARSRSRILLALFLSSAALLAQGNDGGANGKPAAPKPAPGKIDFATQVLPILEKRCFECHRSPHTDSAGKQKKPKGGVIFDSKEGIKASKKGKLVVPKKPGDSKMIEAVSLAADDEDRMPPAKAGDPLTKDQIELLTKWIEQGAEFGSWNGASGKATDKPGDKDKKPADGKGGDKNDKGARLLRELGAGLEALPDEARSSLAKVHARLDGVADDSPLVRVSFLGHEDAIDDAAVAALLPAKEHIAELVLARTRVTDAAMAQLAAMPRLYHLDLRDTAVGDAGVKALAALPELRRLNLFGSKVGDAGLEALAQCAHLEELYVWQTDVTATAVVALQQRLPQARIVFAADLPEPMAEGDARRPRRPGR
jgi:hypothetical protein